MALLEPTNRQIVLYNRLKGQYGNRPEWTQLAKFRAFERMTPHRAFHFLQMVIKVFEGRIPRSTCNCTERDLREAQRHPAVPPGVRDVARV